MWLRTNPLYSSFWTYTYSNIIGGLLFDKYYYSVDSEIKYAWWNLHSSGGPRIISKQNVISDGKKSHRGRKRESRADGGVWGVGVRLLFYIGWLGKVSPKRWHLSKDSKWWSETMWNTFWEKVLGKRNTCKGLELGTWVAYLRESKRLHGYSTMKGQ